MNNTARIVVDNNSGNPRLRLRGTVDGKLKVLKTVKGIGAEAEAQIRAFAEAEGWQVEEHERATGSLRFIELATQFLQSYNKLSVTPATKETRRKEVEQLVAFFGDRFVNDITLDDIEDYKASRIVTKGPRKGQPLRGSTLKIEIAAFRQIISWAHENKIGGVNISARIAKNPKDVKPRTGDAPTEQEIHQLLTGTSEAWHERVILLGFYTGLRAGPSELLKLRWSDVRWNDDPSKVYLEAPNSLKGVVRYGDTRKVPVNKDHLLGHLKRWYRQDMAAGVGENAKIIRSRYGDGLKGPITIGSWKKIFHKAGIDTSRRYFRPYDLRAGFVTHCALKAVDRRAVIKTVGHANGNMIDAHYDRVRFEEVQTEINTKLAATGKGDNEERLVKIIEQQQKQIAELQASNQQLQAKLDQFFALVNGA